MRRRNVSTENLKECIADALLRLLKKNSIDKLKIQDISEEADVNRVSFYRHFKSKEDILYFKCQLIGSRWYNALTPEQHTVPALQIRAFFEMMNENREMLTTMYSANLHHIALSALYHSVRDDLLKKHDDSAYTIAFLSYGAFGIVTEWLNDGCRKTPEQLTELMMGSIQLKNVPKLHRE